MPITGWPQDNNNGHSMEYFDGDSDPDTWCSSSDSLALGPLCRPSVLPVSIGPGGSETALCPTLQICATKSRSGPNDTDAYTDVFAEEEIEFNASQVDNYCCYADVTDWVAGNPINARYTVANVVSREASSCWGGWVLVIVYEDALSPMRNLTLFDGLAMITGSGGNNNAVDVPISGFLTPPMGPVDLQLGVVAFDGDRGEGGDQLGFNGTGTVEYISDATHDVNNAFNSTHSRDGMMNPWRQPAFNNTLGHDANIFIPDNSNFEFLPNNATDASIRITTGGESITVQVITSVIDVYEPDLRATVFIEDLDGGLAEPGDILEYTVVGKNLGSDAATDVYITETLDLRTNFVSGSLEWVSGPLTGTMTDAEGDDAGEFLVDDQMVRVRAGVGANLNTGGTLDNDPLGMDSVAFKFQVQLTDDCLLLQCDGTLTGAANIFGQGDISGNAQSNDGASGLSDANGCPVEGVTVLDVQTGVCPPVVIEPSGTTCLGDDVSLSVPQFSNNPLAASLANYAWSGPDGYSGGTATAFIANATDINAGVYNLEVTFSGLECLLSSAAYTLNVHVPEPDFDPPGAQCLEDNAFNFEGEGAAFADAVYSWTFENGTPNISAGTFINDIQFNTGGWNTIGLTLEEIGCTASMTDSIFIELPPVLTPFPIEVWPDSGCVPLTVNFVDPAPAIPLDYSWTFGDGTSTLTDAPTHVYEQIGTYGITVSAASLGNCPAFISFDVSDVVTVLPNPEAGFEVEPAVVELLEPVVTMTSLTSTSNTVSYWMSDGGSLSTPNGQYIFDDGGTFDVVQTVISPAGCTSTASAEVVVNGTIFHAPSAFTPNGDFVNDTWQPVALGVTSYALEVRNRWGALVWSTADAGEPWLGQVADGSHFVPDGTYHWKVTYRDQLGFPKVKQGTLTVFR